VRFGGAAIAATALVLALGLAACGGGGGAPQASAHQAGAGQGPERRAPAGDPRAEEPTAAGCGRLLHGHLARMDTLRSRLAVGLGYEDYLAAVRSVRAAHSRIDVDRLQFGCVSLAGAPAERALNAYIGAVNTWGDCLAEASCAPESVEPRLQAAWRRAAASLASAERGLRRLAGG
jgi:hypothetical protein